MKAKNVFSFSDLFVTTDEQFAIGDKTFKFRALSLAESAQIDDSAADGTLAQLPIIAKILSARADTPVDVEWLSENATVPMLRELIMALTFGKLPDGGKGKAKA